MLAAFGFGVLDFVLRRERVELLKRVALVNALWLATMTIVSLRYFFVVPTSFLVTTLLPFILAWMKCLLALDQRGLACELVLSPAPIT
jgi:hypothetical protein